MPKGSLIYRLPNEYLLPFIWLFFLSFLVCLVNARLGAFQIETGKKNLLALIAFRQIDYLTKTLCFPQVELFFAKFYCFEPLKSTLPSYSSTIVSRCHYLSCLRLRRLKNPFPGNFAVFYFVHDSNSFISFPSLPVVFQFFRSSISTQSYFFINCFPLVLRQGKKDFQEASWLIDCSLEWIELSKGSWNILHDEGSMVTW